MNGRNTHLFLYLPFSSNSQGVFLSPRQFCQATLRFVIVNCLLKLVLDVSLCRRYEMSVTLLPLGKAELTFCSSAIKADVRPPTVIHLMVAGLPFG
jgi:hypothetical protein